MNIKFRTYLLGLLTVCFCLASIAFAHPFDAIDDETAFISSNFTLDEALEIAFRQNRAIISSDIAYDKADAMVGQARTAMSTKVTANWKQTRLGYETLMMPAGIPVNKKDNQSYYAELTQPLYLGQKDKAAVNSARLGRETAGFAKTLTRQQIVMAVSMKYYNWLYSRAVEAVSKQDLDLAEAHFNLVDKRYKAEQTSKYELLRAEVRFTQAKSEYMKSQNDTNLAKLDLLNILSLPIDLKIDTDTDLKIVEYEATPRDDLLIINDLREDLKIRKNLTKIAEQSKIAAKGEKKPTLALWAQYGGEDPSSRYSGAFKRDNYWMGGLAMELPLVDAGLMKTKLSEANADLKQAQNDYREALELSKTEIKQAALSLHSSSEIVAAQLENMKQAEETVRLAKVRYENGIFTQVDLFDAENAWSKAQLYYYQAVLGHHNARLAYQLAIGKLGRDIINSGK
jgi:outer membrane protein TolC